MIVVGAVPGGRGHTGWWLWLIHSLAWRDCSEIDGKKHPFMEIGFVNEKSV